ncbi:hypothetical protein, partial [Sphingomonas koreensis]
ADLPCLSALRARRRRSGRKMIVLRSDSGETHVRRHATWGMYVKKIALAVAASTMALSGVAHASAAQSLSLKNVPARAASVDSKSNKQLGPVNPLFIVLGIVAIVGVLEITGAINIFGDDTPDSP